MWLSPLNLIPSAPILPSTFVCIDGVQGDFFCRPATGANDVPIGISQIGYDLPPGLIATLSQGTATYAQVAAQAGEQIEIFHSGTVCPLQLGAGGCTAGALLGPNTSGQGIMVAQGSGAWFGAITQSSGNQGERVNFVLTHFGRA
jgi:hypothetical protein